MAKRSPKAKFLSGKNSPRSSAAFWHPLVHRRFGEELFYFLIAVRPFDHSKSFEALRKAMNDFGISKYCAYQIFGQFDMMVRVWLPAGQSQDFIDLVAGKMDNLGNIIDFRVTRTSESWRFSEPLEEEAKELATHITSRDIKEVQNGNAKTLLSKLTDVGIYKFVEDYLSKNPKSIKAFIAISEPQNASLKRREVIFKEFVNKLHGIPRSNQPTVYAGSGFTWILIKVVLEDYYAIEKIVDALVGDLEGEIVSTNTYLVASGKYLEGDCISTRALENKEGNENVRLLLPELYSTNGIDEAFKYRLESFVKQKIVEANRLEFTNKLALQGFLRAVVLNSAIDAFTALFPSFVQTEQELRQLLINASKKVPGGIEDVVLTIDPERKYIKNIKTMPLAMVLRGCTHVAKKLATGQTQSFDEMSPGLIDLITNARNRIMHGSEFDPRMEWELFANALVDLSIIRSHLVQHLSKI